MDAQKLKKAADRLRKQDRLLMGSKWQNCEAEVIATQTILACDNNLSEIGDAFSWMMSSAMSGRRMCGTDNWKGLEKLQNDGSIVIEQYRGVGVPPDGVAREDGVPLVARVTDSLLDYVESCR